uniref:Uncharacterized protein n=1 Tax=Anguilla anguilla TaxID=7936 RepID=A0A0E9VHR1_ANGAN
MLSSCSDEGQFQASEIQGYCWRAGMHKVVLSHVIVVCQTLATNPSVSL